MGRSDVVRLVGGTSRSVEKRDAFAAEFGCRTYEDIDALLRDPAVDGVVVTVPNDQHAQVIQQVTAGRKGVYVEKPIANTLEDGLLMVRAAQKAKVPFAVGHSARLLAGTQAMQAAISRGDIGEVVLMEANFSNDRALELNPTKWRWYKKYTPGGPLSQLAIHHFDNLQALGGPIAEVSAYGAKVVTEAEVDDVAVCVCRFEDGKLGYNGTAWASPGVYRLTVFGTEALMQYDLDFNWWDRADQLHEHSTLYLQGRHRGYGERTMLEVPKGDMFRAELEDFGMAIKENRAPTLTGEAGLYALAAVYAAIRSQETGRTVSLQEELARAEAGVEG
jgi:predicted dehydrogenase